MAYMDVCDDRRRGHFSSSEREGRVIVTHLFSAPLIEITKTEGAKKVDELSYEEEGSTLVKTLSGAGKEIHFMSEAANTKSFARAVGCPPPSGGGSAHCPRPNRRDGARRIVHFTGHGEKGQLTLEDDRGQVQYVDAQGLLAMMQCRQVGDPGGFASNAARPGCWGAASEEPGSCYGGFAAGAGGYAPFDENAAMAAPPPELDGEEAMDLGGDDAAPAPLNGLQLVFLSSCYSQSVADCFIEAGVRHVIAVKEDCKVLDHKAADFAESFYTSLLRGDTVKQAFMLGSDRLLGVSDNPAEGHKFLLLPPNGNHDIRLFAKVPPGRFWNETPEKPLYRCDAVAEHFWGRAVDVQKVVKHMVDDARCVTITGQKGIGKTQVLVRACAYTRERHVFGEIFFCRVNKAGRVNDASNWLEKGLQLPAGSLLAYNMEGAVVQITNHVNQELTRLRRRGSRASRRALLVLDGCEPHVVVGQERVELKFFLSRLLAALPKLTVAVTMRATGPTEPGRVGVRGEEVVVVEGLDDTSTAELFAMSCSRKLHFVEMDPSNVAKLNPDGSPDWVGTFAKGDIVRALKGHPACVQDLCRRVPDERSLFLRRKRLLEVDIPELQKQYAYEERPATSNIDSVVDPVPFIRERETETEALDRFWGVVTGTNFRFYESAQAEDAGVAWGRLREGIERCFASRVPGARDLPLENADFELFTEDPALWRKGPSPDAMAREQGREVSDVLISRDKFKHFWCWFWQATKILRLTGAWVAGEGVGKRGFARFIKRSLAEQLLAEAKPGTFLIRFSTSQPGALAVHYKSRKSRRVIHAAVNVGTHGGVSCRIGTAVEQFRDLECLALSIKHLVYLHPSTPKGEIFSTPTRRSSLPTNMDHGEGRDPRGDGGEGRYWDGAARRQSLPPAIVSSGRRLR